MGDDASMGEGDAADNAATLYTLRQGCWDEVARCFVRCSYVEGSGGAALQAVRADTGEDLLVAAITPSMGFMLKNETIVSFVDSAAPDDTNKHFALSFPDPQSCATVWTQICRVQGTFVEDDNAMVEAAAAAAAAAAGADGSMDGEQGQPQQGEGVAFARALPETLTTGNLQQACEVLLGSAPMMRIHIAQEVLADDQKFLRDLFSIFSDLEDLEDAASLLFVFHIVRSLILLNVAELLYAIYGGRYVVLVAAALEYDPERPIGTLKHREVVAQLEHVPQLVEDPPLTDLTLDLVRQNVRLAYFKDSVIRKLLDDQALNSLHSLIVNNNQHIVVNVCKTQGYLPAVFRLVKQPPSAAKRSAALAFLKELCMLARDLPPKVRDHFYASLCDVEDAPVFDLFVLVLADAQASARDRTNVMDALLCALHADPQLVQEYIDAFARHPGQAPNPTSGSGADPTLAAALAADGAGAGAGAAAAAEEGGPPSLLYLIVRQLIVADDLGVLGQVSEVLHGLLDPAAGKQESFATLWHETYLSWFVQPLYMRDAEHPHPDCLKASKNYVVELLCYLLPTQDFRAKYFILRNSSFCPRVMALLGYEDKHLKLTGIRFLKSLVNMSDGSINHHLIGANVFKQVVETLRDNQAPRRFRAGVRPAGGFAGRRTDNLVFSAVLDLINSIAISGNKHHALVKHLVETHGPALQATVAEDPTLARLRLAYEQRQDLEQNPDQFAASAPAAAEEDMRRRAELYDDSYFFADEDVGGGEAAAGEEEEVPMESEPPPPPPPPVRQAPEPEADPLATFTSSSKKRRPKQARKLAVVLASSSSSSSSSASSSASSSSSSSSSSAGAGSAMEESPKRPRV